MADVNISPNMNLPIPIPSLTVGPDWAQDVVASLNQIDSHNHSIDQGVPVSPDGILINGDLPFNNNNLTTARSIRFFPQGSPLAELTDIECIYVSGVDLYYNDGAGNTVRLTQGGAVSGAAGTITGLPSGTASAAYAAGVFSFRSSTNTPATMSVGPVAIGRQSASPYYVTITPSSSQAADYDLTLPVANPASNALLQSDSSGNLSWFVGSAQTISRPLSSALICTSGTVNVGTTTNIVLSGGSSGAVYQISGCVNINSTGGAIPPILVSIGVSTASASLPSNTVLAVPGANGDFLIENRSNAQITNTVFSIPAYRITVAPSTTRTLYLVASVTAGGSMTANGYLTALLVFAG